MKRKMKRFCLLLAAVVSAVLSASAQDIEINETNFPDQNFRNWILSQSYGSDGVLTADEIENITSIDVAVGTIYSLEGLSYFSELQTLNCNNNQLKTLDVSANSKLRTLHCRLNQLTSLKLGQLDYLETLNADRNRLETIDVTSLPSLSSLTVYRNRLHCEEIDKLLNSITNVNNATVVLYVTGSIGYEPNHNGISQALREGNCILKRHLDQLHSAKGGAIDRDFRTVYNPSLIRSEYQNDDDTQCQNLVFNSELIPDDTFRQYLISEYGFTEGATFYSCKLESIKSLTLSNVSMENPGLNNFPNLTRLYYFDQGFPLSTIDLSSQTSLQVIRVYNQPSLTTLDLSSCKYIKSIYCHNNSLTSITLPDDAFKSYTNCAFVLYGNQLGEVAMGDIISKLSSTSTGVFRVANYTERLETNFWSRELYESLPSGWKGQYLSNYVKSDRDVWMTGFPEEGTAYFQDDYDEICIDEINFPDPVFRAVVASTLGVAEGSCVIKYKLHMTKSITNNGLSYFGRIADITGIEHFPSLNGLFLPSHKITSLDLSKNPKLVKVNVTGNYIHCQEMTKLIESLPENTSGTPCDLIVQPTDDSVVKGCNVILASDVVKAKAKGWNVYEHQITTSNSYDASNKSSEYSGVTFPDDFVCEPHKLDFSSVPDPNFQTALEEVVVVPYNMHTCNADDFCGRLTELDVHDRNIDDFTGVFDLFPNLASFNVSFNPMSSKVLNIDGNSTLKIMDLSNCPGIEEVNITNCTGLEILKLDPNDDAPTNSIAQSNLSRYANYNLRKLNLSGCTNLKGSSPVNSTNTSFRLNCQLAVASLSNYEQYYCNLEEVNLSGCQKITNFECYSSRLKSLNLSGCTKLTAININQSLIGQDDIDLTGCNNLREIVAHRSNFTDLAPFYSSFSSSLQQLQINGGKYSRSQYPGAGDDYITYTNSLREIDMSQVPASVEIFMARHNLLKQLTIHNKPNIRQTQLNNNMLWCADLSGLNAIQATTLNSTNLTKQYLQVSSQRPTTDLTIVKGEAADGSEDRVLVYVPDDVYDDFNTDLLDRTSMMFNGKALSSDAFKHEGGKKYFELTSVAAGQKSDLNAYHLKNGLTYKYDTQAMGDLSTIVNCSRNGKTFTKEELYNNFADVRIMDVGVTLYPYVMYVNPLTKSGTDAKTGKEVDYYSGTLWLDYHSVVPEGTTAYIATGVRKDFVIHSGFGNDQAENQLVLEKIGDPGDIIPAGTAIYVRSNTQAGLYAFHKVFEPEFLGWDGPGASSTTSDTLVVGEYYTDEQLAEIESQLAKIGDRNLLEGSGSPTVFDNEREALILTLNSQRGTNMIGFWPFNGTTVPAHRAFIRETVYNEALGNYENNQSGTTGATFYFADDEETEPLVITDVTTGIPTNVDDNWYTISGMRLSERPQQSGVYLHRGKKVYVK